MEKKYIVTIMDKIDLDGEASVLKYNHIEIGEIDEKTLIFKDTKGNEYLPMLDNTEDSGSLVYTNVLDLHDIKQVIGNGELSFRESVEKYKNECKNMFYYVGKTNTGNLFSINMNLNDILEKKDELFSQLPNYETFTDEIELEDGYSQDLSMLIQKIEAGEFNYGELNKMSSSLSFQIKEANKVSDAIENKISSMNGVEEEYEKYSKEEQEFSEIESYLKDYFDYNEDDNFVDYLKKIIIEGYLNNDDILYKKGAEESLKVREKLKRYFILDIERLQVREKERKNTKEYKQRISINDVYDLVTKTLIAQDKPARRVIAEIAMKEMHKNKREMGILLTGQTGVGKTKLMNLISKYLDKPFHKIDSTQLTVPGYIGKDIEEELWELYEKCNYDIEKAQNAIIFFDEIDKKGSEKKSDISGRGVLNVLLPFIGGSVYEIGHSVQIDTTNMIVVLAGAYTDVYKNLYGRNIAGFNQSMDNSKKKREATTQDFIEKGKMTDEFMGRVTVIKLNDLDVDAIKRIMLESDESALKIQEKIFNELGVKLTFTDGYINMIAEDAFKKNTGARGLDSVIDNTIWEAFDEVYSNEGKYEEVILTEDTVKDSSVYQLVKKK